MDVLKKGSMKFVTLAVLAVFLLLPHRAFAESPTDATQRYYNVIYQTVSYRSGLGTEWSQWITQAILAYSAKWGVNPLLITAMFAIESNFRMDAQSSAGAIGIAQLMPGTARALGIDPYDPAQNIEGGIQYFRNQRDTFSYAGDWAATYAVAAYNAGPAAIRQYGGVPPYSETVNHLYRVAAIYQQLEQEFSQGS